MARGPGADHRGGYDEYAAAGDVYQDPYGEDTEQPGAGKTGRNGRAKTKKGRAKNRAPEDRAPEDRAARDRVSEPADRRGRRGKRPLGLIALAVAAVVVIGAAAYVFVLKPDAKNATNAGPLPTASAQPSAQPCVKVYGLYCHIENRTDDPTPLTVAELFPPVVNNETNGHDHQLVHPGHDQGRQDVLRRGHRLQPDHGAEGRGLHAGAARQLRVR